MTCIKTLQRDHKAKGWCASHGVKHTDSGDEVISENWYVDGITVTGAITELQRIKDGETVRLRWLSRVLAELATECKMEADSIEEDAQEDGTIVEVA